LLFHATLEENVSLFNNEVPDDLITEVIEIAQLRTLQKELNTSGRLIGDQGVLISGGEKQRIAFARALLYKPPFIIIDEATTGLDFDTETALLKNLNIYLPNLTCLFITHRLNSVKGFEKILVLNDGTIAEQGNHFKLLSDKGFYYKLWKNQENQPSLKNL